MKRGAKLSAIGLTLTLAVLQCATAQAAGRGRLSGVVCDQTGAPLVGATIAIFNAAAESDQPVRSVATDDQGRFETAVAPGRYLLKAVASGFADFEAGARVAANRETILETINLRRDDTFADQRRVSRGNDRYRQVARSSRGHVFQYAEPSKDAPDTDDAVALTDRDDSVHGVTQTVAASGAESYLATNFAVTHHVAGSDVTVVGQSRLGESSPNRLEASTDRDLGESHRLNVTLGYGRLDTTRATTTPLEQYTLQVVDRWQIAGPLAFVYGFNYTKFGGASNQSTALPRFGVEYAPSNRTQIFAHLTPGASVPEVASFDLETGEATFVEPSRPNVSAERLGEATPDRSRRFEVGFGHLISERSNVEVMAFFDTASGRGVGFLAVPAPGADPEFSTGSLDGSTSGARVMYTRRMSDHLTATLGYAAGRGLRLGDGGVNDPTALFKSATFQVLAARLQADFRTGTRISAIYRFSPNTVVFAIDPFAGRLSAFEPTASIFIAQTIPMPDFLPGQWEALVDVRNIFDAVPANEERDVFLNDYSRLVRAGLSFRF